MFLSGLRIVLSLTVEKNFYRKLYILYFAYI
jgi:hypothetical protein